MDQVLIVIPARLASVRLPEKPLALIHGKPMIQWVFEAAQKVKINSKIVVATDHLKIFECVKNFGGNALLTSENCLNGTERVYEASLKYGDQFEYIVNLQGDEPMMQPELIEAGIRMVRDQGFDIGSVMTDIVNTEELIDPSCVKVIVDQTGKALYFSRYPIPFSRVLPENFVQNKSKPYVYRHLGLYVYKKEILKKIMSHQPIFLEQAESLEQLRALYLGHSIGLAYSPGFRGISVDTPEDLDKVKKALESSSF